MGRQSHATARPSSTLLTSAVDRSMVEWLPDRIGRLTLIFFSTPERAQFCSDAPPNSKSCPHALAFGCVRFSSRHGCQRGYRMLALIHDMLHEWDGQLLRAFRRAACELVSHVTLEFGACYRSTEERGGPNPSRSALRFFSDHVPLWTSAPFTCTSFLSHPAPTHPPTSWPG